MLRDATNGPFTNNRINISETYGTWYEYVPVSIRDFKRKARTIIEKFDPTKLAIRIQSVNAALEMVDKKDKRVNFFSTTEEWGEAYWQLYCAGYICLGYRNDDKSIIQFFAIPEDIRKHRNKS